MRCSTRSASTERDDDGIRLLPDGRSAQIIVETAGESTLETDVLELVTDHWRKVGIALFIRTSQRDVFRSRAIGGADHDGDLVGHRQWRADGRHEPRRSWRRRSTTSCNGRSGACYYLSHGQKGAAPDLPEAVELVELLKQWRRLARA